MSRRNLRFSAVRTEGGLLPQDLLSRIQAGDKDLPGLTPESYHLGPHERIGEAANRAWSRLTGAWRTFQDALAKEPDAAKATGLTRERWLLPLFQELGYGRLPRGSAIEADGKSYAVSHMSPWAPVHLLGAGVDLDRRQAGVSGAAKASPHGLVQEFLNRSETYLWGFVSNGLQLRILRDHHSLTRQAYVEFDLQALMEGEQYSDFLLLWMICHQSRVEADKPTDCWLERWFTASRDEGIRALDKLRGGVEKAIESLGTGFLAHLANVNLHKALETGELDKQEYYRQILRLVYRLIFLFVAEERDALLDPQADEASKRRYLRFYAARRLRELSAKRRGSPHGDLWQGLRLVMSKLDDGCPDLALPALGSRLWGPTACPSLMDAECSNEHLLDAVRHISNIEESRTRYPVNWRNIGADELGSIYEGLLELHPRVNKDAAAFALETAAGHERKTSGSYYTPTELVDCLLGSALEPVLDEACKKPDRETAILGLKACDPACGSGHFLVAAARRIAKRLAVVRAGEDEPSPREMQRALRDVVGRCIFGVDVNPMAVELCKVSLWMEAIEPGRPLSFLDSHIQCGNALLGTTPALMARGIPDEAFNVIEGDDSDVAKSLKKRNQQERTSKQLALDFVPPLDPGIVEEFLACDESADFNLAAIREHEKCWLNMQQSNTYRDAQFRADAWCAAFVWPKQPGDVGDAAVTAEVWRRLQLDTSTVRPATRKAVRELTKQYRFFHWHLAFPQVFDVKQCFEQDEILGCEGGFDIIIGNPPWEAEELVEREYFAASAPAIAEARTKSQRSALIADLEHSRPDLFAQWTATRRAYSGRTHFGRTAGLQPLGGRGKLNTYRLFGELAANLAGQAGYVGLILKSGIINAQDSGPLFASWIRDNRVVSAFDFINRKQLFPGVVANERFCLLTLAQTGRNVAKAKYLFGLESPAEIIHGAILEMSADDIAVINPNDLSVPPASSPISLRLLLEIHQRHPILRSTDGVQNQWGIHYAQGHLNSASGSRLFKDLTAEFFRAEGLSTDNFVEVTGEGTLGADYLPLYEGKYIAQMNHRFGTFRDVPEERRFGVKAEPAHPAPEQLADPCYEIEPRYWLRRSDAEKLFSDKRTRHPWLFAFRDVCRAIVDARTVQACVLPLYPCVDGAPLLVFSDEAPVAARNALLLNGTWSSFVFDFAARQKIPGAHLTKAIAYQLPVASPSAFEEPFMEGTFADFLVPRVLECTYVTWTLCGFAVSLGYTGPPFRWDGERRFLLRAELDAAFFHLYGVSRNDTEYILGTFDVLERAEVREHGAYRTKLQVLEIYDRMQRAIHRGENYQTLLSPPPADPRVAHDENTRRHRMKPGAPATVVPFRRPAFQLPTWGPDVLRVVVARFGGDDARAWGSNLSGNDLLRYALAAVLRVLSDPWPSVDIQRAVIAVVWPNVLASHLDSDMEAEFRRLVGAENLSRPVAPIGDWRQQVRLAISHQLMQVENGRWAAGPEVDDAYDIALTARATVTVAWMLSEHRDDAVFEPLEALLA